MSRTPLNASRRLGRETGETILAYELMGEQAASLGRMGRKVEAAIAALEAADEATRAARVAEAADLVWGFLIQRELMGLRDRDRVVAEYRIPRAVMARLGAR